MKIYTKTGDKGTTMLFGGGRVPKHHVRIESYGTVDELNSYLGLLHAQSSDSLHRQWLEEIQNRLFTLGAILATDPSKDKVKSPNLLESDVELLEQAIDKMNETLPPLTNFVLPGGHPTTAHCHIARCICRRAERRVTHLTEIEPDTVPAIVVRYLNRLSDFLFVLSRKISYDLAAPEIIWSPRK